MIRLALLALATLYWLAVCRLSGVAEPWDADRYWPLWYPASLALAAGGGAVLRRRGWQAGAIVTLAQLPVMIAHTGIGALWAAGALILTALALPAIAVAAGAGLVAGRLRPDRQRPHPSDRTSNR